MGRLAFVACMCVMAAACVAPKSSPPEMATFIDAAISNPARPAVDTARDTFRKPDEMLAFSGVKPGDRVADFVAGEGYFTRLFSGAVGSSGKVYTAMPNNPDGTAPKVAAITSEPAFANVSLLTIGPGDFKPPEPIDVLWTAQNYHDLHLSAFKLDVAATLKTFFDAVKPGGVFIVVDHVAAPGTGLEVPDRLHRINPEIVKAELTAAGFVFEAESDVLHNPLDDHTLEPIDPLVRGKTDQFVFRFRKPE